jgi:hypothetical protein
MHAAVCCLKKFAATGSLGCNPLLGGKDSRDELMHLLAASKSVRCLNHIALCV